MVGDHEYMIMEVDVPMEVMLNEEPTKKEPPAPERIGNPSV